MYLIFRADDEDVTVEVKPDDKDWLLKLGDQEVPFQARPDGNGAWLVETHQGRRRLWVASRGDERLVFCDGRTHTLRVVDPQHADDEAAIAGGPDLIADMPGKVVQVLVEPGQEVASGQTLIIIESMKMESELLAGVAGTVAAVHVTGGQLVGQGEALVDISPLD